MVKERSEDLTIVCKAWPVRNGQRFSKSAFILDWERGLIHCPNQVAVPFRARSFVIIAFSQFIDPSFYAFVRNSGYSIMFTQLAFSQARSFMVHCYSRAIKN